MKKSENLTKPAVNNLNIDEYMIIKLPKPQKCTNLEKINSVENIFNQLFDNIQNSGLLDFDTLSDIKYLVTDYLSSTTNWTIIEDIEDY
jgi:hypothetical protein